MTDTIERALEERQQLSRAYRIAKNAQFKRAYEAEPRLLDLDKQLRGCGIEDADIMIDLCRTHDAAWLRNTDDETRALALELVARRIAQIRVHARLVPFDDPLPGEPDDMWQICRKILT